MFPRISHPRTPLGSFSQQDAGMGRNHQGWGQHGHQVHPKATCKVRRAPGNWDPRPARPVPGAPDGGGGGGSIPALLTPGPLETQFPLSVERGHSRKAVRSTQGNQCAKSLKCGNRDQVTVLPETWLHAQQLKKRAFRATYARTFKS